MAEDMKPVIIKMGEEASELYARLEKLARFLTSEIYQLLSHEEKSLVTAQFGAMTAYYQILSVRIGQAVDKVIRDA